MPDYLSFDSVEIGPASGKKQKKSKKKHEEAPAEPRREGDAKKTREPVHPAFRLGSDQYDAIEPAAGSPAESGDLEEMNVVRISELAEEWKTELDQLRDQKVLGTKGLERMKVLEAKLQKYAAMEEFWGASAKLRATERECDELARKQIEDRRKLEKLAEKKDQAQQTVVALSEKRTAKERTLKQRLEALNEKKDAADVSASSPVDANELRGEIASFEEEIRRADADVKLFSMQVNNLRSFIANRGSQLRMLEGKIKRIRLELVPLGAVAAQLGGFEAGDGETEPNIEGGEGSETPDFKKPHSKVVAAVKKAADTAAEKTGNAVAKSPLLLPLGIAGGLGFFALFSGSFKSWGRRLSNPHRFWDDIIKRLNTDFEDPPKGKGFIMGGASFMSWFLFGETKMAPHDTVHKDFV